MVTEQQPLEHNNLTEELIQQLRSDCLNRELEETLEGMSTFVNLYNSVTYLLSVSVLTL
jgi:hypothetical protein